MSLIGIDLHSDSFFVVRTRETEQGLIRTERKYELHGESWRVFTSSFTKEDYVLIEATSNSFWFRDRILPHVRECFILNMYKVGFSGNKTDKIDGVPRRPPFLWVRDPPWQLPVQPCSEECMERGNPGP